MLRKNIIKQQPLPANNCSVQTQTQQFLIFLPIQQKLKDLMSQYHTLQTQHEQTMNKNQYLLYKNQLLESSLLELTYVFNNNLLTGNIKHLQDIVNLQQLIQQQTNGLLIKRIPIEEKKAQQKQKKSHKNASKEQKIQHVSKQKIEPSHLKFEQSSRSAHMPALSNHSINDQTSRRLFEQDSAQNQFLLMEKPQFSQTNANLGTFLHEKKSKQYNNGLHKVHPQTSRNNRSQPKYHTTIKKKSINNEKQNLCVQKMIKIQAELKLKKFMSEFQKSQRINTAKSKVLNTEQNTVYLLMQQTNVSQALEKQPLFSSYSLKSSVR